MNPFRTSQKIQEIRPQNPYFSKQTCGVCLQNTYDYSPFGASLDERTVEGGFYRRGFNGMEKDDEFKGKGNSYDFGARMYDSRVGRFFYPDPKSKSYPDLCEYVFVANNPIYFIDIDGKKIIVPIVDQATVISYVEDQFGGPIYTFKKNGEMKLNKKEYNAISGSFNDEQKEIFISMTKVINSKRILEVQITMDDNLNFKRNPLVRENYIDENGMNKFRFMPEYDGEGIIIPQLTQEGLTFLVSANDDRAFIFINAKRASIGTFEAADGAKTSASASSVYIHEILDHGLDYIETGTIDEPVNSTKKDNVKFHNLALKNKKSIERTGNDHN
jgi:RHS repeat-associated protein